MNPKDLEGFLQFADAESAELVGFVGNQVGVWFTNDFALLA